MRCSRCATENRDGASFCRECGTHLDPRCPGCGSLIARESKFCDACGTALGGALASVHLGPPES